MTASEPFDLAGLPDPTDRDAAWHEGVPAYLAWWTRLMTVGAEPGHVYHQVREHRLVREYAEAVPDLNALAVLADLGPLLEIGAGTGYWARLLRDHDADVEAVDSGREHRGERPWTPLTIANHTAAVDHADRALFVSWPPRPTGFLRDLLSLAPQRTLALITTGTDPQLDDDPGLAVLRRSWHQVRRVEIPTWPARGDDLTTWARR